MAIALAATMPSLVSSLVISDSTGIPLGPLPRVALRRLIEMVMETPKVKPVPMLGFSQALLYNGVFRTQNVIQSARLGLEKDLRPLLPQIQSPTLVLWGGNDRFIRVQLGYEFAQHIPDARMIIAEGEYHEWAMFRPEKFVPMILDFLDKVEKSGSFCSRYADK